MLVSAARPAGCGSGPSVSERFDVFKLPPEVEGSDGYVHAIRVGDRVLISGAVTMDPAGKPTAAGDLEQQMKNCYADLRAVPAHSGCMFEDVVVEKVFTTDMSQFLEVAGHRPSIYGGRCPTGTWVEVKGLALPEFMIEIELQAQPGGGVTVAAARDAA